MADKNKKAYALMHYECSTCQRHEVIWNSRDGAVPQAVPCGRPGCRGAAYHTNWHLDQRRRHHVLFNGQRYFIDMAQDRALILAQEVLGRRKLQGELEGKPFEYTSERVLELANSFMADGSEPDLLTWFAVNRGLNALVLP